MIDDPNTKYQEEDYEDEYWLDRRVGAEDLGKDKAPRKRRSRDRLRAGSGCEATLFMPPPPKQA